MATLDARVGDRRRGRRTPLWAPVATVVLLALGLGKRHPERRDAEGNLIEDGRGRTADSPAEIPTRGWKDVLLRVFAEIGEDRVLANAAGVTYYVLLALFPAIAAFVSIYALFADPATFERQLEALSMFLPEGAIQIIGEQVQRIASQGEATLGLSFLVGLVVSLWSANAGTKALFDALNIVYGEKEKRGFFRLTLITLGFTLAGIAFILLALAALVVLPVLFNYVGLREETEWFLNVLRWPALLIAITLGISVIYRYGPSREKAQWRWITWGSAVASALWIAASALFSWYAANFGSYNETYGSLGAVIGFMTWIWISAIVVLVGAELDAELEHQTARDTTTGPAKPLGARGAKMADSVAPARR